MPVVGAPSTTAELILDPVSEDAANVEVELSDDNNYIFRAHTYPTPPAAFQWASSVSTEGARLSSQRHENRTITFTVEATGLGALQDLEAKIGKLYREGGTLKRTFADGREIVFDVLTVSNYDAVFEELHHFGGRTPVTVALECKPYGRGAEEDLGDNAETTLPALIFTEADIPGDMPALGRLVIDNDSANPQTFAVWGVQSRHYDSASTAALFYQAESCAIISPAATAVGAAGASGSGSNVVRHGDIGTSPGWNPLIYIGASATAQTHVGSFRVFARFYVPTANTGTLQARVTWKPNVGAWPVTNTAVPLTYGGASAEGWWLLVDLGMISIPETTVGSQGWIGKIEGTSTVAADNLDLDWVMLIPADESSGQIAGTANVLRSIPANGQIEIRHDAVNVTTDSAGYWRRPDRFEGDYLLIPPSGQEARTTRMIVKLAAGVDTAGINSPVVYDPPVIGDQSTDDISARLYVTPRYLVVPEL